MSSLYPARKGGEIPFRYHDRRQSFLGRLLVAVCYLALVLFFISLAIFVVSQKTNVGSLNLNVGGSGTRTLLATGFSGSLCASRGPISVKNFSIGKVI